MKASSLSKRRGNHKSFVVKLKAGIVVQHRGRVLLIRERNNRTGRYKWNVIKGTFEAGKDASIFETAVREAREEANIKIKLRCLLGVYYLLDRGNALMMFAFLAGLTDSRARVVESSKSRIHPGKGESITETKFFSRKELLKLKPEDFIGMRGYLAIQDYLNKKRFPLGIIKTLSSK